MPLGRRLARRSAPALVALSIALFALVLPRVARAWVDVHVAGDDVRVTLDQSGSARIEHKIRLHISGSPLTSFDLRGVDRDAVAEPDGYIVPAHDAAAGGLENAVPIAIELLPLEKPREGQPPPVQVMRVRFGNARGISHGAYVLLLRYKTDLVGRGLAAIEGATARVRWTGPIFDDGFDSARVTFDLLAAPTEPRTEESAPPASDAEDAPTNPPMFLSTVRRGMERDEIELLRPYAPKAEAITWSIRADARALRPASTSPLARSSGAPAAPRTFDRFGAIEPAFLLTAAAALFAFYAALVAWKGLEVTRTARAAGATPRPFVPIPLALRAAGAGICLTVGVALELACETSTAGAVVIALALAFAAHRTPRWIRPRRGPGRWLPISESEAFRDPPRATGAVLDVSTRAGKALLLLGLGAIGAGVFFTWAISPYHAWLIGFDAVALLAVFCTGRLRELPPDPAIDSAPLLRDVAHRVRKQAGDHVRLVPRIRVPLASPDADELRLGVAPRAPIQGLVTIEIGIVYVLGAGGPIALPEILLRVRAGSPCERAVATLAKHGRSLRGRHEGERVLAFAPRLPTARMTAAIAVALAAKASRREGNVARVAAPTPKKRAA